MNAESIISYITTTFTGVDTVTASGNTFFFYNPDPNVPPDHRFSIITLVTNDEYDRYSDLDRPGVFRLNIGVSKQTYLNHFSHKAVDGTESYDYTTLNTLMPHPEYGRMYWLCVLSPDDEMFEKQVKPLLAEAYEMAVAKHNRQLARA